MKQWIQTPLLTSTGPLADTFVLAPLWGQNIWIFSNLRVSTSARWIWKKEGRQNVGSQDPAGVLGSGAPYETF